MQRSFRLGRQTADRLDAAVASSGESRNRLADRLISEALTMEQHPLVRFRSTAAGRREPAVAGSRLYVRDVILTVRAHDNDVGAAASYLDLPRRVVDAAVAYYAEHTHDVDADITRAEHAAQDEQARWERQQAALA